MEQKKKRTMAAIASIIVVAAALGYLVLGSFQESLVYFYTPSEVMADEVKLEGKKIRLAGTVTPGSLVRSSDRIHAEFTLSDGSAVIPVKFKGVIPDLFAEGQMAVAEGRKQGSVFEAEHIMAKHSEDYDAKEVKDPQAHERKPEKW